MTLTEFKEIYEKTSPLERLNLLVISLERKGDNRVSWAKAGTDDEKSYYLGEMAAMDARAEWLYKSLAATLSRKETTNED